MGFTNKTGDKVQRVYFGKLLMALSTCLVVNKALEFNIKIKFIFGKKFSLLN